MALYLQNIMKFSWWFTKALFIGINTEYIELYIVILHLIKLEIQTERYEHIYIQFV